jgi:hypothetical protein
MTFKELKDQLNTLSDLQLNQEVRVGTETATIAIGTLWIAPEDQINPSGEGPEGISEYKDDPESLRGEPIVLAKGMPILFGKE